MSRNMRSKREDKKPTTMLSCLSRMKSAMGCIQSSIATVYSVYSKFCKETTLHGLKHTVAENFNVFERFLWFVLTVCAFTGAGYCALNQLGRYNSEPVVVSLQRDYRGWATAFPALTACLLERVQQDKARAAIFRIWNITEEEDPEKYQYYYEFVELVAEISFRGNIQNFWKYQGDDSVDNIDLTALAREVHPPFELQVETSQRNLEVRWVQVMTEEGLCQTFNSVYAQYQVTDDDTWKEEPLMTCHYHSENCYVKINSMSNAMRYFIHSPYEISTAISNPTGEIYPGDELSTDFKVVEIEAASRIKGLSPAQRRCHYPDEWLAKSIKAYSFSLCQMQCRTHMAVMFCGCRPYFHIKGDGDICDARGMACIGRNVEILVNLPKNLAKCSCMPQCDELNYYSHTKKVNVRYMNETESETAEAKVQFSLMPPKFRLHRDIIFSLDDLFFFYFNAASPITHSGSHTLLLTFLMFFQAASLGGTTALFVGASVLTVAETILFIVRHIVSFIYRRYLLRFK